ncbi:MAG: vanadium-dependent haloperoxidase [Candidatus Eisenbacteria bacterium]|uniref:Vanadium-dependent haloperoxidase n=1 Tax=Eiseniibacteriota bacterium TaxID=2212470 RepID=A0A7Y2E674_UNCEI|nr:vanadium-dependent haloperoxidase [Candidatus Eisenbacteria bacterium]
MGSAAGTTETRNQILSWNKLVFELAIEEDKLLTLKGLRTATMMHLAIHDALNTIEPRYEPYRYAGRAANANPEIITAAAASEVLRHHYPNQKARINDLVSAHVDHGELNQTEIAVVQIGRASAQAMIAEREGDNWNSEAEYVWHPMAPGVYAEFKDHSGTPEGFIFGTGWAQAKPFVLSKPSQFRSPPPPAIQSDAYTKAYNEVKEVGRFQSMTRTPDQTHLALWWKDFIENSHNRLARALAVETGLDGWQTARMFALLNMAIYDAYLSSFENKFHYNHWRPYTAIRWAANDGNEDTIPDELWDNTHRHTYPFPSYPSAHGTAAGAAMTALAEVLGDNMAFTMHTETVDAAGPFGAKIAMNPPAREFNSFSEAALECAMSRVYLGIHFRYDSVEGNKLGKQVGMWVVKHALREKK